MQVHFRWTFVKVECARCSGHTIVSLTLTKGEIEIVTVELRYLCGRYIGWVAAGLRPKCLKKTLCGIGSADIQIKLG